MSFSIVVSGRGVVELAIEGDLDEATISILRIELATLLRSRPRRVELRVAHPSLVGNSGRILLMSFFHLHSAG